MTPRRKLTGSPRRRRWPHESPTRRFHAGAYCAAYDLEEDDDQAKRVIRKAQTGLVVRAVQGLKILRAALHDARGVKERFGIMRFRFWSPSRIVQAFGKGPLQPYGSRPRERRSTESAGSPSDS